MTGRILLAALCLLVSGCFATTVRSGKPPAREAVYELWHDNFVAGLIEASGPHDLKRLCPEGWSEIHTSLRPMQVLTSWVTLLIYTPQTITVICAAPGGPDTPPKEGHSPANAGYPERPPPVAPLPGTTQQTQSETTP